MKRVYISGPITGTDDYLERFAVAEDFLKAGGYEVINPAIICDLLPQTFIHEEYMAVCLPMVGCCDGVYMLEGWRDSKGAGEEHEYAWNNGIFVIYE